MTLRDLVKKFYEGRAPGTWAEHDKDVEGMRAVVRALRDEVSKHDYLREVDFMFNEILGAAGDEVAGRVGETKHPDVTSPATDPAPAVCEWTCVAEGAEYDIYDVGCDSESLSAWRRPEHCPSCGKPIKFTEAQR